MMHDANTKDSADEGPENVGFPAWGSTLYSAQVS